MSVLDYRDGEYIAVCHDDEGTPFTTTVLPWQDAAHYMTTLPRSANVWFGFNPVRSEVSGRRRQVDVTRLVAVTADVDVKPGACPDFETAWALIAEMSTLLGANPVAVVMSGHGLQPYWLIEDGESLANAQACALSRRFGRLVALVAERRKIKLDNTSDASRVLRVPGGINHKDRSNPVAARLMQLDQPGGPLNVEELEDRLDEAGVYQCDSDELDETLVVSEPDSWKFADQTCWYVAKMVAGWATDVPDSRHPWALSQSVRLNCAWRLGCISEEDFTAAKRELARRFVELLATGIPRNPGRYEMAGIWRDGRQIAARKTDTEAGHELNDHAHEAFTIEAPTVGSADGLVLANLVTGAEFILDIPDTMPVVWGTQNDVLWMEGESLMIAGPMGLGKTTLGTQLMRAQMGLGSPNVLGLPVTPCRGKILYLAMDRPPQAARAMARQFTESDRQVLAEKLVVWKGPPPNDIASNPGLLLRLTDAAGADVVYLDSIKDAAIGLSEDEVGSGYNRARQLLLQSGRQLCELHHTTKRGANGGPPKDVSDIYGSTWITNGTGSIVLLSGQPGDPIVGFLHARQPMGEVGPFRLLHDHQAGELSVHHEIDLVSLVAHAGPHGLTAKDAAALLFEIGEGGKPDATQIEKARRRLNRLESQGLLTCLTGDSRTQKSTVWFVNDSTSFS